MKLSWIVIGMVTFSSCAWAAENSLKSPNVSANALLLYRNSNFAKDDASTDRNGFDIQEAELAFYADVDPYSRLFMLFSIAPEYTVNGTGTGVTQSWTFEPEELFVESEHVPSIGLKLGKFKSAFGKHNLLHSHAYPFVDAPMVNSMLLGKEGLSDVGVSASVLVPLPWFSEITAQFLRGEGENDEFNSPTPGDGVGVGHWKNLWDLNDDLTFELGASYAYGNNQFQGVTSLMGGDLTLKWRPTAGGKYHSGILGVEVIDRAMEHSINMRERDLGGAAWMQYQFAERWAGKLRFDNLIVKDTQDPTNRPDGTTDRYTAQIQFDATEFSIFRLEYSTARGPLQVDEKNTEHKVYLQANFTIGSHPAHKY